MVAVSVSVFLNRLNVYAIAPRHTHVLEASCMSMHYCDRLYLCVTGCVQLVHLCLTFWTVRGVLPSQPLRVTRYRLILRTV